MTRRGWECGRCSDFDRRGKRVEPMPELVFDVGILMPGPPTLRGHRLGAEFLADNVWSLGLGYVAGMYELQRVDLLVVCWWAGQYGPRRYRQRWGEWAAEAERHLWYACERIDDDPPWSKSVPPTEPRAVPCGPPSPREADLLAFVRAFRLDHLYSPTLREMAEAMGWESTSTAHLYLDRLEAKGLIAPRTHGASRSVVLTEELDVAGSAP